MEKQEKKDVLTEIRRLTKKDFLNGNDLLYFFCKEYPIPTSEEVEEQRKKKEAAESLTPAEAHFADQMWLIGRAYAASPERYSYKKKGQRSGKPKEGILTREGYESFFQDVARILFRKECREKYVTYFRGERINLKGELNKLKEKREAVGNLVDKLTFLIKDMGISKEGSDVMLSHQDIQGIAEILTENNCFIHEAMSWLESIDKVRSLLPKESHSPDAGMKLFKTNDKNERHEFSKAYLGTMASCVATFAKALNAARILRDTTIVIRTLTSLNIEEFKDKRGKPRKGKLREWAFFSKGAKHLIEGEPYVSISFSSKFLHFHYPQLFFIFDTISETNAPQLPKLFTKYDPKEYDSSIERSPEEALKKFEAGNERGETANSPSETEKARLIDYYQHAAHELAFAYYLIDQMTASVNKWAELLESLNEGRSQKADKDSPIPHYMSITRLVDELVMSFDAADI